MSVERKQYLGNGLAYSESPNQTSSLPPSSFQSPTSSSSSSSSFSLRSIRLSSTSSGSSSSSSSASSHSSFSSSSSTPSGSNFGSNPEEFVKLFYLEPPALETTLDGLEVYVLHRLHLLTDIHNLTVRRANKNTNENPSYHQPIDDSACKNSIFSRLIDPTKDTYSHFLLQLEVCLAGSEDDRRLFIKREVEILRLRLETKQNDDQFIASLMELLQAKQFLSPDMTFCPINKMDVDQSLWESMLFEELSKKKTSPSFAGLSEHEMGQYSRFIVPFQDAFPLISKRRAFLLHGWAYLSTANFISVLLDKYAEHLRHNIASRTLQLQFLITSGEELDERLMQLLSIINTYRLHLQSSIGIEPTGSIKVDEIPQLSARSFPLCMSHLYSKLYEHSHLKHGGRWQLSSFLKGIGLSFSDNMKLWQSAFKGTPQDVFQRKYAYNIKHLYGKVGCGTSYSSSSCFRIQKENPATGQYHGCPFRVYGESGLNKLLASSRLSASQREKIVAQSKEQRFTEACKSYLHYTHLGLSSEGENRMSPTIYFRLCEKYHESKKIDDKHE